jgi:hypothetical protein
MEVLMAHPSATEFAHGLKGAHFPINKKQLAELAHKNKASKDVVDAIKGMPDKEFASMADVEHVFSRSQKKP